MFCHKCGMENPEGANHCSSCGEQLKVDLLKENLIVKDVEIDTQQPNKDIDSVQVKNPLVWSILITIFGFFTCCLNPVSIVLGIIAIVFSSRIDEKQRRGDYVGAKNDAKTAVILNWVGLGSILLAIIGIVIFGIMSFLGYGDFNYINRL